MGRKITRKGLIRSNDKLCSEYVRSKYKQCIFRHTTADIKGCTGGAENAFHFVGRRCHILRWDITTPNVVASCWPHNSKYSGKWGGSDQSAYWQVYLDLFGREAWNKLIEKRRQIADYGFAELQEMNEFFKILIETQKRI